MKISNYSKFILNVIICQLIGIIGSTFTRSSVPTWYAGLNKPDFNPPNWIFAPVWFTLYFMMGTSSYLIWIKGIENKSVKISLIIFLFQLILNALWTYFFFGLHSPFYAFIDIIALWIVILLVSLNFYRHSKTAGLLLIPYILWVSFAGVLNYYILVLNQ